MALKKKRRKVRKPPKKAIKRKGLGRLVNKLKGATLIEILIAMAIVGILLASVIYSYAISQKKGKDSKRKLELGQTQEALEMYYNDYGSYPPSENGQIVASGAVLSWGSEFKNEEGTIYMKKLPEEKAQFPAFCYKTNDSKTLYVIFSVLENQNDPDYNAKCPNGYSACGGVYNYYVLSQNTAFNLEDFDASCVEGGEPTTEPTTAPTEEPTTAVPTSTPRPTNTPTPTPGSYDCVYYPCSDSQSICSVGEPTCPAGVACGYGCPPPDFDEWCEGFYDRGQAMCSEGETFYSWFECTVYPGEGDGESLWCASEPDGWSGVYYYPTSTPFPLPTSTPAPTPTNVLTWQPPTGAISDCEYLTAEPVYENNDCTGSVIGSYPSYEHCNDNGSGTCYAVTGELAGYGYMKSSAYQCTSYKVGAYPMAACTFR